MHCEDLHRSRSFDEVLQCWTCRSTYSCVLVSSARIMTSWATNRIRCSGESMLFKNILQFEKIIFLQSSTLRFAFQIVHRIATGVLLQWAKAAMKISVGTPTTSICMVCEVMPLISYTLWVSSMIWKLQKRLSS